MPTEQEHASNTGGAPPLVSVVIEPSRCANPATTTSCPSCADDRADLTQTFPPERREIVVVFDSGVSSHDAEEVRRRYPAVRLVHGAAASYLAEKNAGAAAALGAIVALVDGDCVPDATWLATHVARIEGGADVVAGRTRYSGGSLGARIWAGCARVRRTGARRRADCDRAASEGVDVLSPMILPLPYARWAQAVNQPLLRRPIERWLAAPGHAAPPNTRRLWRASRHQPTAQAAPTIVITFLPTPLARATMRALAPALSVFYCADRLSESSPAAARLAAHEQTMFAEADLVLRSPSAAAIRTGNSSNNGALATSRIG